MESRYFIISNSSQLDFECAVEELIDKGYLCQGGVFVLTENGYGRVFYQAMVKDLSDDE